MRKVWRQLGREGISVGRSMAVDFLIWLSYRLHHLERPTRMPWAALYQQFGGGFALAR